MAKQQKELYIIIFLLALVGIVFLSLRISGIFGFSVLVVLVVGSLGAGFYYLGRAIYEYYQQQKNGNSIESSIFQRQRHCQQQIERLELEVQDIYLNILELKSQMSPSFDIPETTRQETERLVNAFQKESDLRKTKIAFYRTCLEKLQALLHHHQLTKKLERQQQKLKQLREKNYDELGDIERFKSNLEQDQYYLETIETLTLKMLKSGTLDNAEELKLELLEMTQELDRL